MNMEELYNERDELLRRLEFLEEEMRAIRQWMNEYAWKILRWAELGMYDLVAPALEANGDQGDNCLELSYYTEARDRTQCLLDEVEHAITATERENEEFIMDWWYTEAGWQ